MKKNMTCLFVVGLQMALYCGSVVASTESCHYRVCKSSGCTKEVQYRASTHSDCTTALESIYLDELGEESLEVRGGYRPINSDRPESEISFSTKKEQAVYLSTFRVECQNGHRPTEVRCSVNLGSSKLSEVVLMQQAPTAKINVAMGRETLNGTITASWQYTVLENNQRQLQVMVYADVEFYTSANSTNTRYTGLMFTLNP